jgi:hypothetical protein
MVGETVDVELASMVDETMIEIEFVPNWASRRRGLEPHWAAGSIGDIVVSSIGVREAQEGHLAQLESGQNKQKNVHSRSLTLTLCLTA